MASVHYFCLVKITALIYPLIYATLLALLLGWRVQNGIARYRAASEKAKPTSQPIRFFRTRP